MNVNRLCGSGLQAIVSAAQTILLGDAEIAIGGGAESMSRGPYFMNGARWGGRMGDLQATDYMLGILHDPFHAIHMGITAENVAARDGITREMQDALAVESQQRAAQAIAEGRFKSQIVPVEIKTRKGTVVFDTDEHVRGDTTIEQLAKMKPAFKKDGSGDRRQRIGPERRRRRGGAGERRRAEVVEPEAARAAGRLRARRRRSEADGHRPGAGRRARC